MSGPMRAQRKPISISYEELELATAAHQLGWTPGMGEPVWYSKWSSHDGHANRWHPGCCVEVDAEAPGGGPSVWPFRIEGWDGELVQRSSEGLLPRWSPL